MGSPVQDKSEGVQAKTAYHHGDLREALIAAAHQLVNEKGSDQFALADACRVAGVSTAAPYRHFRDRQDLLGELVARGFQMLKSRMLEAMRPYETGSVESITAIGHAYVGLARDEPALFRMMFSTKPHKKDKGHADGTGGGAFQVLLDEVSAYLRAHGQERDVIETAVPLWTFVHGAASLLIDRDYEAVAPETDVEALVNNATWGLLQVKETAG